MTGQRLSFANAIEVAVTVSKFTLFVICVTCMVLSQYHNIKDYDTTQQNLLGRKETNEALSGAALRRTEWALRRGFVFRR